MILSASRRTDIPALYGEWLVNRLAAGEVLIPQPYRAHHATRLLFSPETVDVLVLWSKNPAPFFTALDRVENLGYKNLVFQYTITAFDAPWEPHLPPLKQRVQTFSQLAWRLGPARVDWRFDPILLDSERTPAWYGARFQKLCEELASCTTRCILSFADLYPHQGHLFQEASQAQMEETVCRLGEIAQRFGLPLFTCAEAGDFTAWGIRPGACLDQKRLESVMGCSLKTRKDPGQRPACGCVESVDLGVYNTCIHGCAYCYATRSVSQAKRRYASHDPRSPLLTGWPSPDWKITEKRPGSLKTGQLSLF